MPRNREFEVVAQRRRDSSFGINKFAVPDERARPGELEAGDSRVSESVCGMMLAAVSGSVVGLLAGGGVACAALVFVAVVVGVYTGWHARGGD
jgi:hypothetical protein